MSHSKVDLWIKAAIGGLLLALGFVIVYTIQDHIVEVGDTAPNFTITTDRGVRISPRNFGGKLLILNFWATWCAPCVQEAPSLNQLARAFEGSGVVVLGISVDRNEKLYQAFLKRFQIGFQTARDPDENINPTYGTYKIPETYFIDRNGKVLQKVVSAPPGGWMDPALVSYIKSQL